MPSVWSRSKISGICLCLALALALVAGACGTDIQSGIESANDLLYRQEYVEAERLFRKLLKRIETFGDLSEGEEQQRLLILDRLGKTNALYLHDYSQAIADYGLLVRLHPKTDPALAARAGVADIYQHKLGNLEAAIDEYQKLVTEFPNRTETRWAQLQIIQGYLQLKNYDQARTEAEALINRWPDSKEAAQARFQTANSYYVQERYAEAIATYERLLEGKPDPSLAALVLFELGNCFQELGESERALAYFYACLPDHPNPLLVQRKIKRVRRRLGRSKPSANIYNQSYRNHSAAILAGSSAPSTTPSTPSSERRSTSSDLVPSVRATGTPTTGSSAATPVKKVGISATQAPDADASGAPVPKAPSHTSAPSPKAPRLNSPAPEPKPSEPKPSEPAPSEPAPKAAPKPASDGSLPDSGGP